MNFTLPLHVDFSKQLWGNTLKNLEPPYHGSRGTEEGLSLPLGFHLFHVLREPGCQIRQVALYLWEWRWGPDGPICPGGGLSESRGGVLWETQVKKLSFYHKCLEVIPYLFNSRLDSFSPLRNMNLGYKFFLWWISGINYPSVVHLPYPPLSTNI